MHVYGSLSLALDAVPCTPAVPVVIGRQRGKIACLHTMTHTATAHPTQHPLCLHSLAAGPARPSVASATTMEAGRTAAVVPPACRTKGNRDATCRQNGATPFWCTIRTLGAPARSSTPAACAGRPPACAALPQPAQARAAIVQSRPGPAHMHTHICVQFNNVTLCMCACSCSHRCGRKEAAHTQ